MNISTISSTLIKAVSKKTLSLEKNWGIKISQPLATDTFQKTTNTVARVSSNFKEISDKEFKELKKQLKPFYSKNLNKYNVLVLDKLAKKQDTNIGKYLLERREDFLPYIKDESDMRLSLRVLSNADFNKNKKIQR